jgi:hypothetical protein
MEGLIEIPLTENLKFNGSVSRMTDTYVRLTTGNCARDILRNYVSSLFIHNILMTKNYEVRPHILPRQSRRD